MRVFPKWGRFYAEVERNARVAGKRVRFTRKSFESAVAAAEQIEREIREHGQLAVALSSEDRVEMVRCQRICAPYGITPIVACHEYDERHKGSKRPFLDIVAEIVASKGSKGRSPRYVAALERDLLTLDAQNPGKGIADYTTADLDRELQRHLNWSPTTIRGAVQSWNVIFNYAVKFEYRKDNPCQRLDLPRIIRKEPTKFPVATIQRGLALCLTTRALLDCLAWFAIGNFAGLRPEEMEKLRWEQVSFETASIIVLANTSKRRQRRVVKLQPVLIAWLRPLYRERGPVMPLSLAKTRTRMRSALGLAKWPADIMRHDFASYHYHKWHDLEETRYQLGQDDDTPAIFFNHYCALVIPPDQDLFWESFPPWKSDLELAAKYLRDIGWAVKMQLRTLLLTE